MATNRPLGLPPITPELKSIAPYLQRADELKSQDPIIAYWCAYYAAQLGISLKAKDHSSRDVLFNLLSVLERIKKEIGSNDAIDMEAASSAYVENFALKVFTAADNEDRAGNGSRSVSTYWTAYTL
jgi:vacuolar protein sorting-associated protein VTA1